MPTPTGALPQTQQAFDGLTSALAQRGIASRLADFGGTRTQADTDLILGYRQQDYNASHGLPADTVTDVSVLNAYRPIAPYGESFHNYGAAFDLLLGNQASPPLMLPSGMTTAGAYQVAATLAPSFGLRWGGYFENPDIRHFELDMPLSDVRDAYATMTGGAQLPPSTSAFDLSAFLPGLSPSPGQPLPDLSDLPPLEVIGEPDDSGESAGFMDGTGQIPQADAQQWRQWGFLALAGAAIGVVVWGLSRRLSPRKTPQTPEYA